ncbi:hypothetical protein DE146DRAFT_404176 [Phaeosphaeria sp. MPI-PUGE-AT-0046c]|nr:hypothetical protein DE146DRAFT_404176 [Phaeosphaeria sp. MPI-PUGE-AT-0046c]
MVRRYIIQEDDSPSPEDMITRSGSSNSTSGRHILTPSSRNRRSSATGSLITPSSGSDIRSDVHVTPPAPENPASAPFVFGAPQSSSYSFDPDTPIPSVERDDSPTSDQQSNASTEHRTPSLSSDTQSTTQVVSPDASLQSLSGMGDLRLTTPQPPPATAPRASRTPSIHVTSSPPIDRTGGSRSSRNESITAGIAAMRMESQRADSLSPATVHENRSPSPSRRRRSGSGVCREIHQVESESPPEVFSRMMEFQEALANARTLTGRIRTTLSSSALVHENGSSIRALHTQAVKLDEFQLPSSRIIGLVGDSGVGKSSLINSLLDRNALARASGSGTACTCAVTEYHFHEQDDFVVHVDYFSLDQLRQQFEELLTAHRDFEKLGTRGRGGTGNETPDDERQQLRKKSELAIETFRACLGERVREMPGLLSTMSFERAVTTMIDWASERLPTQVERLSFGAIEECSSWLRDISSDPGPESSSPGSNTRPSWPFIQKIRVHLKANILSKGLIIADLPGLRDLNSARQAITERYIRQCHQILVVARIDRAVTDESIKYICELARRVELTKIDIVCTRSEEVNAREAIHDWPAERATIEELQQAIDTQQEEIEVLQEDIDEYGQDVTDLTREQERELLELQRDLIKAKKTKSERELELKRFIVQLRNNRVSHGLRQTYRAYPVAASLQIFCVSNQAYWDNRKRPADVALPYLTFSGIIELRRYCIGIVGQSRLQAIRTFIKDDIPALVGSIELWIEVGSGSVTAESKQSILDAVDDIQQEFDQLISPASRLYQISRALHTQFNNEVYMRMSVNSQQWGEDARRASLQWEGWHHMAYKAFCSHYGNHNTNSVGYHCWNQEAVQGMTADLRTFWNSFTADVETEIERVGAVVTQTFTEIIQIAVSVAAGISRANDTGSGMRTFAANLQHRERLVSYGIEQVAEDSASKLLALRADAVAHVRTSFIGRLMEATYHAANIDFGGGSDRRRKNLVTGRFSSAALFTEHRRSCRDKLRQIAQELQEQMMEVVSVQVELVEADMQLLRDGNAILESERDLDFKRRVEEELVFVDTEVERLGRIVQDD